MAIEFYVRLGRVAYEAYFEERNGQTHDALPMPAWDDLGDGVRAGWQAAARAALKAGLRPGGN